jgi:hypothetical protein
VGQCISAFSLVVGLDASCFASSFDQASHLTRRNWDEKPCRRTGQNGLPSVIVALHQLNASVPNEGNFGNQPVPVSGVAPPPRSNRRSRPETDRLSYHRMRHTIYFWVMCCHMRIGDEGLTYHIPLEQVHPSPNVMRHQRKLLHQQAFPNAGQSDNEHKLV